MTTKNRQRLTAYFYLLINTVCWGAALIVVKPAFEVTTPFRFLFYRFVLAIVLTLPLLIWYLRQKKYRHKLHIQFGKVFALELVGTGLALGALYLGLDRTSAIDASLITTTSPIFVTLLGIWWLRERQQLNEWLGMAVAFIGTVGLTLLPFLSTNFKWDVLTWGGAYFIGNALVFANNLFTAGYFIGAKQHYAKWPKLLMTTLSFYVGAAFFGIAAWLETPQWSALATAIQIDLRTPSVWLASGYMAVFGSIIGLTAYIKGQDKIEASEASIFWYLQPAVYLPLGYFWLNETITTGQVIMLGMILTGVIIAEKRWRKSHRLIT